MSSRINDELKLSLIQFNNIYLPMWEEFPDFQVYMDQLVSLGNRYLKDLSDSELTPSMINSYVKKGLMQRPEKKKYDASHIAELLVISLLKTIYPLEVVKNCINEILKEQSVEQAYNSFANLFNDTLHNIENSSYNFIDTSNTLELTEKFAIRAVICKLVSQKLIDSYYKNKTKMPNAKYISTTIIFWMRERNFVPGIETAKNRVIAITATIFW